MAKDKTSIKSLVIAIFASLTVLTLAVSNTANASSYANVQIINLNSYEDLKISNCSKVNDDASVGNWPSDTLTIKASSGASFNSSPWISMSNKSFALAPKGVGIKCDVSGKKQKGSFKLEIPAVGSVKFKTDGECWIYRSTYKIHYYYIYVGCNGTLKKVPITP